MDYVVLSLEGYTSDAYQKVQQFFLFFFPPVLEIKPNYIPDT